MTSAQAPCPPVADGEGLLRTALDCYLTAILRFAECLEAVRPEIAAPYRDHLIRLRKRLAFESTAQTLEESREVLCIDLANFSVKAREYRDLQTVDLSQVTALPA